MVSTPMASSSRWLVGSSSSRHCGRVVITVASASRVRCPPESVPTARAVVERAQAELLGGDLGAPVGVPGVVVDGVLQRRGVRRLALVVVEVGRQLLDAAYGVPQRPQRRREHLADGAVVAERRLLTEQHEVGRRLDGAGHARRLREPAGDGAQQRGLAGAVLADQPDPAPGLGDQVDPGQRGAVTEGDGEVADDDRLKSRHEEVLTMVLVTRRASASVTSRVRQRST